MVFILLSRLLALWIVTEGIKVMHLISSVCVDSGETSKDKEETRFY